MTANEMRIAKFTIKNKVLFYLDECETHEERKEFLAYCRNMTKKEYQRECRAEQTERSE